MKFPMLRENACSSIAMFLITLDNGYRTAAYPVLGNCEGHEFKTCLKTGTPHWLLSESKFDEDFVPMYDGGKRILKPERVRAWEPMNPAEWEIERMGRRRQ